MRKCGCLFTCLTIRPVHLKLVKGLSAPLFLNSLKRFVARRGKPKLIVSDNAPQFHFVKSVLDTQWSTIFQGNEVLDYFSYEGIQWNLTTSLASWQRGFYEQSVTLLKQSLRKEMGHKIIYWDKLMTLLIEVEAIINTRLLIEVEAIINTHPLTYVYEEFKSGYNDTSSFANRKSWDRYSFCIDNCEDSN